MATIPRECLDESETMALAAEQKLPRSKLRLLRKLAAGQAWESMPRLNETEGYNLLEELMQAMAGVIVELGELETASLHNGRVVVPVMPILADKNPLFKLVFDPVGGPTWTVNNSEILTGHPNFMLDMVPQDTTEPRDANPSTIYIPPQTIAMHSNFNSINKRFLAEWRQNFKLLDEITLKPTGLFLGGKTYEYLLNLSFKDGVRRFGGDYSAGLGWAIMSIGY